MNRLAPYIHWSLGLGKRVQWSYIAYAPGIEMSAMIGSDDDDPDEDDEDDEPEPST